VIVSERCGCALIWSKTASVFTFDPFDIEELAG
jgi:hypothetical protein